MNNNLIVLKPEDVNVINYPNLSKWPYGLEVREKEYGVMLVSSSTSFEKYYEQTHDYNTVFTCNCKRFTEGHRTCKHMEVAQYVLDQRRKRLDPTSKPIENKPTSTPVKKTNKPTSTPVKDVPIGITAPLNGSRPFSITR